MSLPATLHRVCFHHTLLQVFGRRCYPGVSIKWRVISFYCGASCATGAGHVTSLLAFTTVHIQNYVVFLFLQQLRVLVVRCGKLKQISAATGCLAAHCVCAWHCFVMLVCLVPFGVHQPHTRGPYASAALAAVSSQKRLPGRNFWFGCLLGVWRWQLQSVFDVM
jgi:hypothetical protein